MTEQRIPLVLDLDGTLTPGDTLAEGWLRLVRRAPHQAIRALWWLFRGRAYCKTRLASESPLVAADLLWNDDLLLWIRAERESGRMIVLATGAAEPWALTVATHLGLFDEVIATRDGVNLVGSAKRLALDKRYGAVGWDYVGDGGSDRKVWAGARFSYTVDTAKAVQGSVAHIPATQRRIKGIRVWLRAIRVLQWSKNLLVFAPAVLSHDARLVQNLMYSAVAFVSFSTLASATYLLNDALDLPHDRAHPRKRRRPLASGEVSLRQGAVVGMALFMVSFLLGAWLGTAFTATLGAYVVLTLTYSFWLKRRVSADVIALASLYVLRLVAGSAATGVTLSAWFLAFAVFFFTSLGFAKRATEIAALGTDDGDPAGRGYRQSDLSVLVALGSSAAYTAVLVFALYLSSPEVRILYVHPDYLWVVALVLMGWISRIWLIAQRGQLGDDPVVFAIRDKVSLALGTACVLTIVAAAWR